MQSEVYEMIHGIAQWSVDHHCYLATEFDKCEGSKCVMDFNIDHCELRRALMSGLTVINYAPL